MENLTRKEIDTLVEALESWENKDMVGEMMGDIFGMILTKDSPEAKIKLEEEREAKKYELERKRLERKEESLMLKSKLVMMKREMYLTEITSSLQEKVTV